MLEESTGNFSATRNVYDWYQTATHVILNIMIKNLKESDVKVKLIDETLDVSCSLADGNEFKLHFNLFKSIYVSESNWTVSPSKLEVKLKKTDRKRWQSLEVLPDKSGKRPLSFVGFVAQNTAKKTASADMVRMNTSLTDESGLTSSTTAAAAALAAPKYDWHQTATAVIISIHVANLTEQDVRVEFADNTLFWSCRWSHGPTYNVTLNLFKPILVEQSSWKLTVSKLEIELRKRDPGRWSNLEAPSQMLRPAVSTASTSATATNWQTMKTTITPTTATVGSHTTTAYIHDTTDDGAHAMTGAATAIVDEDGQIHLITDNNGQVVCSANATGDGVVLTTTTTAADGGHHSNNKTFNYTLVSLEPTDIVHEEPEEDVDDDGVQQDNNGFDGHETVANNSVVIKNDKVLQNLDKLVTDFKEREAKETATGGADGTVDELLREIYEKGGEEVRRAMNKRFTEGSAAATTTPSGDELKPDVRVQLGVDAIAAATVDDSHSHQIDLSDDVCNQLSHTLEESPQV